MNKDVLNQIIDDLENKKTPRLLPQDFSCFSEEGSEGKSFLSAQVLGDIASTLTEADIPTFKRALRAIEEGDLAWIGFKVVFDADAALRNTDNEVTKKYGDQGSADGSPLVFFCNDVKEVVASRTYSPRDFFQMKDATRGPSMHNDQFEGLTWTSVALFDPIKVWLLGASDVACELAALARHVGFEVVVLDYDPAYISEERFPHVQRIVLEKFSDIDTLKAAPCDYVCVLTRGHMFDPEGCLWACAQQAHYVGLMGCAGKNNRVYELCHEAGMSDEEWAHIRRPIGIKFGAKSPAELAIAIVAELIDVRYHNRYSEEARQRHETSLGRK